MTAQGGLKAVPAHGNVFYIDSGVTPKVDAAYVGYRIENSSGGTITGLWVSIESFVGGKLSLANPLDQYQQMDPVTNSGYKTAFYLLKAIGPTTISQTHTIKVFNKRPDLSGATTLLTCDFSFSQIQETIKANANKVTSVTGALSPTTATLGGTLTISVAGDTGKVGGGKSPDFSIIWVSPAAVSTWPTRSLRLESTRVDLNCRSITDIVLIDTLIQSSADSCFTNPNDSWTATYVFRIIGPGPASLTPSPIANIASGTQYKHSDITSLAFGTGINLSGVATSTFTVNVTASSSVISSTSSSARIRYTITLSTTSTTSVEVDEVIDRPASGTTLVSGTSTLNGSAISDPLSLASESALSPPPLHYIGPFSVVSGSNVVIVFDRNIPCGSSAASYGNTSYAKTGDQILGSATTTIPGVTVTTLTSGATCGATVTDNPQTISPTALTSPATSVSSSGATLNGFANAYGQASVTTYFKYSTDRNLVNSVSTTTAASLTGSSTVEINSSITGLASGTTYYFQIAVTSSVTNITSYGATLSFTTEVVQAIPTVVTSAATTVADASATLNGHVNPNLTSVTKVQFIFGLTSASVSDNSATTRCVTGSPAKNSPCIVQVDDGTGALTNLTLTGSGQTEVSYDVNGLTAATTYFFKLQVLCTEDVTYCPGGSVSGAVLQFKTGAPQVVTTDATSVAETTATLNGSMSSTGSSVKYQFYYCAASASCSAASLSGGSTVGTSANVTNPFNSTITHNLTGLTGNTTYYYQAQGLVSDVVVSYGEILNFTTILISTSSLANGTIGSSYTAGLTGVGGVGPYSWSSGTLPTGLTMSSAGVITGTPTTAGTTAVTFTMTDDFYGTSTTKTLNIVIKASVTYALNGGSGTLPTEINHAAGDTFALAASTGLTKNGYTFSKWNDGTTDYNAGATYTMGSSNTTLTAVWVAVNYSVLYDDNVSGETITVPTDAGTYNIGQTVTISAIEPTRTGYTFVGWTTDSGNTGTVYKTVTNASYTVSSSNITFYAKWSLNSYSITFNYNYTGAPSSTVSSLNHFVDALAVGNKPTNPTRTGYDFAGWSESSGGSVITTFTVVGAKTFYAKWTAVSYSITYNYNYVGSPSSSVVSLAYASDALADENKPTNPTRTGYTFSGWSETSTGTVITTFTITGAKTFYAKWAGVTYTLTYDGNTPTTGNPPGTAPYTTGGAAIVVAGNTGTPAVLAKTSYTFGGWYSNTAGTGGTSYSVGSNLTLTADTTIYALWVPVGSKTVTFNSNYGSATTGTQSSATSTTLTANTFTRTGYTFANWNTLESPTSGSPGTTYANSATYDFVADLTLYAQWTANPYTVTYANGGGTGTLPTETDKNYEQTFTLSSGSTLAKIGSSISGWSDGTSSYSVSTTYTMPANNVTLTAQWTAVSYTITYANGGGSGTLPTQVNKEYTQTFSIASGSALTKSGHTFAGWNDGTSSYVATDVYTMPANNVTLTAQWTAISYTVTYANGGGTGTLPTQANRTIGQTFTVAAGTSLSKGTDVFNGWDDGTNTYSAGSTYTMPAANVTLTAQWTSSTPTTYTITYSTSGSESGAAPSPTTGNGSVTLRTNTGGLAKSGYVLNSWNSLANCGGTAYSVGGSFNLTSSITLYPCFIVYVAPEPTPDPEPQPRNNAASKVKPVVVWKNPNAIKTTTTLSTTQLNAVATLQTSVTPTIINPAMPEKLPTGAPTISGTYVYTPIVPAEVTAGVTQVTTITSAANALTGTIKTVPATTTPSVPSNSNSTTNEEEKPVLGQGTTLAPGLQKMKVVFIPTDTTTYEPVETTVEILVQAETKVNWVEPAPIKKTTPVSQAQLNAVGVAPGLSNNVPGTYKYDIPEGTTLAPGKHPVKVTFTPTDPNYLPSEASVTITVTADINPLATPIVTPSNTPAGKPITNTTNAANAKVTAVGKGLTAATTDGVQVNIVPEVKFSGKTTVQVTVNDEGETKEVTVPVTVLPLPAISAVSKPNNIGSSTIAWKPSVNAISYEVTMAGKVVCTTSTTSCVTDTLIGPKSDIQIAAKGNDATVSPLTPAKYMAPKKPITALVVYFDTNKFNLDAKDKAELRAIAKVIIAQGFKNIVVNGHTDVMTGVDNKVLSANRAKATYEYLKQYATGLNVTLGAFASTKPAVLGNSYTALAANRRAEVGVY
jgi:uncharacterized repeat protein (TIGR02543 family)